MYVTLAILALFILVYSMAAGRVERTWLSGPIVFCLFGVLIGPRGFDILPIGTDSETIKTLAELTVGVGLVAATMFLGRFAISRGWGSRDWSLLSVPALALACFALAQVLGGSGFIAAFTGGLVFDIVLKEHRGQWLEEAEGFGNLFSLITWVTFGALVVDPALNAFSWSVVAYSLLSLTVIRMLPVFLSLSGMGMGTEARLFMGWFGPRGLASVVFCVMVIDATLPHVAVLAQVVSVTVLLSILLHGLTANRWARGFGQRAGQDQ